MKKITLITNLAAFYKINLYNKLSELSELDVYFLDRCSSIRNSDFYNHNMKFNYQYLTSLNIFISIKNAVLFSFRSTGDIIILGGWDRIEYYVIALLSPKRKNAVVVESSYLESNTKGLKGWVKRLFLRRISKVYVPGESNKKLLENLHFRGEIIKTYGVGLFNYVKQAPYIAKEGVSKFIYVGRLSSEKNLDYIIKYFNKNPHLTLTIVGYGPLEAELKKIAKNNIIFTGAIDNRELPAMYQSHDLFILPSLSEPWGLVVEEALNNGLPVILSEKVGCAEELVVDGKNGFVFTLDLDFASLDVAIKKAVNIETYNAMRLFISKTDIDEYVDRQINSYLG